MSYGLHIWHIDSPWPIVGPYRRSRSQALVQGHWDMSRSKLENCLKMTFIHVWEVICQLIHGSHCRLSFIILPRKNTLIGYDWFVETQAGIFPHNELLIFAKREISLHTDCCQPEEILLTESVQSDNNELNAIEYEPDADDFECWNIEP